MNTFNTKSDMPTEAHQIMIKEIHVKWGKFSDQELSALKGRDDLVDQVVASCSFHTFWLGPSELRRI